MLSIHGYVSTTPELGKPDTGGQVLFVLELAKRFSRLGCKVDIVTRRFEKQPALEKITPSLRLWRVPFGGKDFLRKEDMHDHLGSFITNFLAEVKTKKLRYDVVNSHYWDAGWAGQRIAEELGIAHVHTPHSLGAWKQKDMQKASTARNMNYRFEERIHKEFLIYRNCDHVIATTNLQYDQLRSDYDVPKEHITIIPPGIDEARFTPIEPSKVKAVRKRLNFRDHDVYTVGRIAPNKGIDLLIKALPHLRKLIPRARLILAVGTSNKQDQQRISHLKKLAGRLNLTSHIHWRGYVPDDQLADHYRSASVFALPSRYEPFGMTAIEAMASGTPSVITVHGGLCEMINFGTHALYADPERPSEYAMALCMPMLYPQLRDKLSIEGARFARRQFGWTGIAKRTLPIFEKYKSEYEQMQNGNGFSSAGAL